jgi:hypothetical protein
MTMPRGSRSNPRNIPTRCVCVASANFFPGLHTTIFGEGARSTNLTIIGNLRVVSRRSTTARV